MVKQFRLEHDMTIAEMARSANLGVGTIHRIENGQGRPTDRTLYKLQRAFPELPVFKARSRGAR